MKRILVVLISLVLLGCASDKPSGDYIAYTETMKAFAAREQQPLMDLQLFPNGTIRGIKMNQQAQIPNIQQARPSPAWGLASKALGVAGTFGAIWAVGNSLENIVDSVSANSGSSISVGDNNSWEAGRDVTQSLGGGVSIDGNTNIFTDNSGMIPDTGTFTYTNTDTGVDMFE